MNLLLNSFHAFWVQLFIYRLKALCNLEPDYFINDKTSSSLIILFMSLIKSRLDISNFLSTPKKPVPSHQRCAAFDLLSSLRAAVKKILNNIQS